MINADFLRPPARLDPWRRLAGAVIAQAAREAYNGDVGAAAWLQSEDCLGLADLVGLDAESVRRRAAIWARRPAGKIVLRAEETMTEHVTAERLEDLRQALARIPGADRRAWILETYQVVDGEELLTACIDIRTGRPWKQPNNYMRGIMQGAVERLGE